MCIKSKIKQNDIAESVKLLKIRMRKRCLTQDFETTQK